MENQAPLNKGPQTDEIDLGQLFRLIGKAFNNLFKRFLRLFLYLKRNIIKLAILGIVGLAIGFGLNKITTKRQKTEVIVKPNLESRNYLYDVVGEIQANIRAKNTSFFNNLGIDVDSLKGFQIQVEPVEQEDNADIENDLKYLELLGKFQNDDLITDVVRTEILNKSTLNHRISFFYKDPETGKEYAKRLVEYINSNGYFNELVKINTENAQERIKQNYSLIEQIDGLIARFSEKMSADEPSMDGKIVLDDEEKLDITGLLGLKNSLIRDIERKKLEIQGQKEAISIINFGQPQEVQKSFFGKTLVLIPTILIVLFFLIDIFRYFNKKASEI